MMLTAEGETWLARHRAEHDADARAFDGWTLAAYQGQVAALVKKTKARTLLDYGCGKADGWKSGAIRISGLMAARFYDPAVAEFAERPVGQFCIVVCCDVLEHVPESDVPAVLDDVLGFARRAAFFSICCRPSIGRFADGGDPHATVRPFAWWLERVAEARARTNCPAVVEAVETL